MAEQVLNEISKMKHRIDQIILSDRDIVSLITDDPLWAVPATNLKFVRVFPFKYVPDVSQGMNTYITYQINIHGINNPAVAQYYLSVYVIVHQDIERIDDEVGQRLGIEDRGTRTDVLCSKIDALINGANGIGIGRSELVDIDDVQISPNFNGRKLLYRIYGWNRTGERLR